MSAEYKIINTVIELLIKVITTIMITIVDAKRLGLIRAYAMPNNPNEAITRFIVMM